MSERPEINWARLWREAKRDSVRDFYGDNREKIRAGLYVGRLVKGGPEMPAKVELIDHEPGDPENKLDTGSIWVAQVGTAEADPLDVMAMHERRPISEGEYAFQMARLTWIQKHAPHEPEASPARHVDLSSLPPIGPSE